MDDREKAFQEMRRLHRELYDSFEDKEEFWAREHWVNNPLIKPKSKVSIVESLEEAALAAGEVIERRRILQLIEDYCSDEHRFGGCECGFLTRLIVEDKVYPD